MPNFLSFLMMQCFMNPCKYLNVEDREILEIFQTQIFYCFSAFQQGVNMNMGDYDGRTALHLASAEGHLRCVRFLLDVCKVHCNFCVCHGDILNKAS